MVSRSAVPVAFTLVAVALVAVMAWSLKIFSRYQPYTGFFGSQLNLTRSYAVELDDVAVHGRQAGRGLWTLRTKQITLSLDRAHLVANGIQDGVFLQDDKPVVTFAADKVVYTAGFINPERGNLDFGGRIRIASSQSVKPIGAKFAIQTDHAIWNGTTSLLSCPESVTAQFTRPEWKGSIKFIANNIAWNNRLNNLHLIDRVQVACPLPNGAGTVDVTSSDVTWDHTASILACAANSHVVSPIAGATAPVVVDAQAATWDQKASILTCAKPVNALLTLPRSTTTVHLLAPTATYASLTGHLTSPAGVHANVSSLGIIDCGQTDVDTKAKSIDFKNLRLASDTNQISVVAEPVSPDAKPTPVDPNRVFVTAPEGGHWDEQQSTLVLRGPVTFKQGDATLTTVGAIYDRKSSTAKALAPVTVTDPESTMTGDNGMIDFKKKVVTVEGKVHLKQTPKDADKETPKDSTKEEGFDTTAKKPTDLNCDKIVYDYKEKKAEATGHLTITQQHRTVTGDVGHYDAKTKVAELVGNVVGKSDDGKVLKAPSATVSIKKGDEWLEFPHSVNFEFTPDEDEDKPKASGKK